MWRSHSRRSSSPQRACRRRARNSAGYACGTKTSLLARDFGRQSKAGARNPCNRASSNHSGAHPPRSAGESASCPSDTSRCLCARRSGTASAVHGSARAPPSPVSANPRHAAPMRRTPSNTHTPNPPSPVRARGPTTPLPPPGGIPPSPARSASPPSPQRRVPPHAHRPPPRGACSSARTPPERSCAPDERRDPFGSPSRNPRLGGLCPSAPPLPRRDSPASPHPRGAPPDSPNSRPHCIKEAST